MRKAIASLIMTAVLVLSLTSGCGVTLKSSGNLKTIYYPYEKFSQVAIDSAFEFEIIKAEEYTVYILADDNLFEHIKVEQDGDKLKVTCKTLSIIGPVTKKLTIGMPRLDSLEVSGASHGTIYNFSTTDDIDINVSGASQLEMVAISVSDAAMEVSGASTVSGALSSSKSVFDVSGASMLELTGKASDIKAEVSGASRANLGEFAASNVQINLSGASTGTVNLTGRLDAEISGASRLEYIGSPTMGNIEIAGASSLSSQK